jgi:hypothetical protein
MVSVLLVLKMQKTKGVLAWILQQEQTGRAAGTDLSNQSLPRKGGFFMRAT